MNTYERALEDQKVTWPTHVTMVWNASWGSLWLKILGWSPAQPCNHRDTSNAHPVLSKTSPPLGPIHRNPHRGNVHRTTISDALLLLPAGISQKKFNVSACVLHCLCAYVFVSECRRWGWGGWDDRSCGANVLTATGSWWMATVVMMTGKWVGGLSYAPQPSEWLEFNTVKKTSEQSGNKVASLLLFTFLYFISLTHVGSELQLLCQYNPDYQCAYH